MDANQHQIAFLFMKINGKTALVTGANRGSGLPI